MKKTLYFNGKKLTLNLEREDFSNRLPAGVTDAMVLFWKGEDGELETVATDQRATDTYTKYAAIHECICLGKYHDLAPKVEDPEAQCGMIDKMILEAMPEPDRLPYLEKRIEMFSMLVSMPNIPESRKGGFRRSLSLLEGIRDKTEAGA